MSNLIELEMPAPNLPVMNLQDLVTEAKVIVIADAHDSDVMGQIYAAICAFERQVDAEFEKMKGPVREAGHAIDAHFRPIRALIKLGKEEVDAKIGAWAQAEQKKRQALATAAREAARQEQERLAREAAAREAQGRQERAQLEAEAKAQAEAGNATAAAELRRRGDHAELAGQQDAQQLLEQVQTTLPIEVPELHRPAGVTLREQPWKWEGIDLLETAKAVAEGRCSAKALAWNEKWLAEQANALRDEFRVPGVVARPQPLGVAARGRK